MISIVTCTYNRALQLHRGLNTLLSQDLPDTEIIIVDDGSRDKTKETVEVLQAASSVDIRYIYIDHPEPRISCIPRNIGWKAAKGDIIIFTEPEALHVGNTIEQLLNKMKEYPDNTILASQVWTMGQRIAEKLNEDTYAHPARILSHEYAQLTSGNMGNTKAPDSDFAISGELNCNAGVLFATRKQWLEDVGGFDESFQGHGFDDFDLFNRLAIYGKGIMKDPEIAVIHQWHEKNYPYNIYDAAESNGKISEANIHKGIYKVNADKELGV